MEVRFDSLMIDVEFQVANLILAHFSKNSQIREFLTFFSPQNFADPSLSTTFSFF